MSKNGIHLLVVRVLIVAVSFHLLASGAEEKAGVLPNMEGVPGIKGEAPKMDGKLNDPAWTNALTLKLEQFVDPSVGKQRLKETTSLKLAMDAENLYMAFDCVESHPGGPHLSTHATHKTTLGGTKKIQPDSPLHVVESDYVYVADYLHQKVVQVKLDYAVVEETPFAK